MGWDGIMVMGWDGMRRDDDGTGHGLSVIVGSLFCCWDSVESDGQRIVFDVTALARLERFVH